MSVPRLSIHVLPGQLFYSTPISACLWFLARNKNPGKGLRDRRGQVLFIDAHRNVANNRVPGNRHRQVASWDSCCCGKFERHSTPSIGRVSNNDHIEQ